MTMKKENQISQEIKHIESQISNLYEKLYEKRPSHFHFRDVINAFMGSTILGLTFVFKGSLIELSLTLTKYHLFFIILTTAILLTFQIYFVGYSRVKQKKKRKFDQFWAKRFFTLYGIAVFVSLALVYLFNMNSLTSSLFDIFKIVVAVSMPCAIGAAVPSLLKRY